ncbi:MAG: O-antigen ligase family protein [Elusimicrobiota bacterium]
MRQAALLLFCLALPISIAGTNIGAGLLCVLILLAALKGRDPGWKRLRNPAILGLALYCAAALIAAWAGLDPRSSLKLLPKDLHKLWLVAVLLLALGEEPRKDHPLLLRALAAGFALIALVGLGQVALGQDASGQWARAHAWVHPVTYGEQLALALLGALCFFDRPEAETSSPAAKRWDWAFILLAAAALVLNQTRGALLGLAAGFAAVCRFDARLRRRSLWALAAAVAIVVLWELLPFDRSLLSLFSAASPDNPHQMRWALWKTAVAIFRDHPWTGAGPGRYHDLFELYHPGPLREDVWGSAHNLYLHQLAERGLLGLTALGAALGTLTLRAYRRCAAAATPWNLWAFGSCAAFLAMSLTEVTFQNEQATSLFLFIWAWAERSHKAVAG